MADRSVESVVGARDDEPASIATADDLPVLVDTEMSGSATVVRAEMPPTSTA
jgi:hypothetical protein